MKAHFDVEKSLELCPPEKRPNVPKGAKWKRRIVLQRGKVKYLNRNQIRVLKVIMDNAASVRISFEVNGYIHTEYPPIITEDPDTKDGFIGETGFTRDQSADMCNWETFMYDVYEFDSPLSLRKMRIKSNIVRTPRKENTKADIINQCVSAIESGEISNSDIDLKEFINDVASDKSEKEKTNIFKSVRGRKSAHPSLLTYHCGEGTNSTVEASIKFNLPYSGAKNYNSTGRLGYIPSSATPKTSFTDSKKLLLEYGYQDIDFYFFMPEPKMPDALYKQRNSHLDKFNDFIKTEAKYLQLILNQFGYKHSVNEILKKLPWKAKGFLPQFVGADSEKGGNPKEETVVDANGIPI
jgi:hypothetical protein